MMDRRRFLLTSMAGAVAGPLAAEAQQAGKVYRVAFLTVLAVPDLVEALRQGLRERGWTEGQNLVLEERFTTEAKIPGLGRRASPQQRGRDRGNRNGHSLSRTIDREYPRGVRHWR
jgi:hypothetical protein